MIPHRKSLGQHYLLNPSTIDKILEKAGLSSKDFVLEIGPGPGVMTAQIIERAKKLVAIEKDRRFVKKLQEKFAGVNKVKIIEGDILNLDLEKTLNETGKKWKVISNLPYNIATEVIFRLLELAYLFDSLYLMVQKEVADRLVAKPGSKDYGILSIFTQLFSENKIVMQLAPGSFTPPPRVRSAVVAFKLAPGCRFSIHHFPTFENVVRIAFGQRRKMIRKILRGGLSEIPPDKIEKALHQADVAPTARAETVSISQFATIANNLTSS